MKTEQPSQKIEMTRTVNKKTNFLMGTSFLGGSQPLHLVKGLFRFSKNGVSRWKLPAYRAIQMPALLANGDDRRDIHP